MVDASKTTVLFVHGSWHTPKHFEPICQKFEAAGFRTCCPRHPSAGNKHSLGVPDDAQNLRNELQRLVDKEEREVVVVAHSYGGVVTTEAVDAGFGLAERQKQGKKGGVVRLVYMCAFMLKVGQCLKNILGDESPPYILFDEDGLTTMLDPGRRFYHDLAEEEQAKWIKELVKSPSIGQRSPVTQASYLFHPVTYLYCEDDQALPVEVQRTMVNNARSEYQGLQVDEVSCTAGHSPFLSQPDVLLALVKRIVEEKIR